MLDVCGKSDDRLAWSRISLEIFHEIVKMLDTCCKSDHRLAPTSAIILFFVFLKVKMLHGGKSDHRLAPTSGCCRWRLPVSGRYVPSKTYYKSFPSKPDGMLRKNFYFQNCSCFQPICSVKDLRHTMQNHSRLNLTTYDVTKLK